jgi:hypothetical protein
MKILLRILEISARNNMLKVLTLLAEYSVDAHYYSYNKTRSSALLLAKISLFLWPIDYNILERL